MAEMIEFNEWFLVNMPNFLISDPVKYFFGLVLIAYCIKIFFSLRKGV